jgi:hypothetical protein
MNSALTAAQNDIAEAGKLDDAKDQTITQQGQQITTLQKQVADLTAAAGIVTISEIQAVMPEQLWYEARSASSPKTGPHGTVTVTPGAPATADFHPVVLADKSSDNVYLLRRLYSTLTAAQKLIMETATKFSISCDYMFDPLASVQAGELDYQIRKSDGTVINVGPQLFPSAGSWQLRGFDFVKKSWVALGVTAKPTPGKMIHIEIQATCDGKTVQFVQVIVDGTATPVAFSHPVTMDVKGQPYCNAAWQLDATGDAKPYKATINNLQVTFS